MDKRGCIIEVVQGRIIEIRPFFVNGHAGNDLLLSWQICCCCADRVKAAVRADVIPLV